MTKNEAFFPTMQGQGRMRAAIFKADDTAHLIVSPKQHNNIRSNVSANSKMAARNRTLDATFDAKGFTKRKRFFPDSTLG